MKTGKALFLLLTGIIVTLLFILNTHKRSATKKSLTTHTSQSPEWNTANLVKNENAGKVLESILNRPYGQQVYLEGDSLDLNATVYKKNDPKLKILGSLATSNEITIGSIHSGCFHHYTEVIIIKKKNDSYTVSLLSDRLISPGDPDAPKLKQELDSSLVRHIQHFQNDCLDFLTTPHGNGCTSSSTYYISTDNKLFMFSDASCSWGGYSDFLKNLNTMHIVAGIDQYH